MALAGLARAAEEAPRVPFTGPIESGPAPAPEVPRDLRPMEETPVGQAGPERKAVEEQLASDIQDWQRRLDQLQAEAAQRGDRQRAERIQRLRQELLAVKMQWQNLRQTSGPRWQTTKTHYDAAYDRFLRSWNEEMAER